MQLSNAIKKPHYMPVTTSYHKSPKQVEAEQVLVEAAKADPAKFAGLYDKYHEPVFRYIHQRMNDTELAFDVTSQVFLKAMLNLHKYEYRGLPFGSWLFRIAKSELYQAFKDKKAERTINVNTSDMHDLFQEMEEEESDERIQLLVEALRDLPVDDVQLIELRFFEKRAFKEVGEILDITENNAKVKTYRVIEKIKKNISKK